MCRVKEDSPLIEFNGLKRVWWKVDNIDNQLYCQHYKPTLYNTTYKILTTEQYVPPYLQCFGEYEINLKQIVHGQNNDESHAIPMVYNCMNRAVVVFMVKKTEKNERQLRMNNCFDLSKFFSTVINSKLNNNEAREGNFFLHSIVCHFGTLLQTPTIM